MFTSIHLYSVFPVPQCSKSSVLKWFKSNPFWDSVLTDDLNWLRTNVPYLWITVECLFAFIFMRECNRSSLGTLPYYVFLLERKIIYHSFRYDKTNCFHLGLIFYYRCSTYVCFFLRAIVSSVSYTTHHTSNN